MELRADEKPSSSPDDRAAKSGLLTVTGSVLTSQGKPAAGALVRFLDTAPGCEEDQILTRTDDAGRFQARGIFVNSLNVHASSADGREQAILPISSAGARKVVATPLEVKLAPADSRTYKIVSDKKPAAGVQVIVSSRTFRSEGVTGANGQVEMLTPKTFTSRQVAWHTELGVAEADDYATLHALNRSKPHTIHVVDSDGKNVSGLELGLNIYLSTRESIYTDDIPAARVRTGSDGKALVPWIPSSILKVVHCRIRTPDWKFDWMDNKANMQGTTTIHVRRQKAILGRLVMPEGISPEGFLISGYAAQPWDHRFERHGITISARARRDGWFTIHVPADHQFVLGLNDIEWTSDLWAGMIGEDEQRASKRITLKAYPAISTRVRLTRGPDHKPAAGKWIEVGIRGEVNWVDNAGRKHSEIRNIHTLFPTDANGEVRPGLRKGHHTIRVFEAGYDEWKEMDVTSDKPIVVEFDQK